MATTYIQKVIEVENKTVEKLEKSKIELDKDYSNYSENLKVDYNKKIAQLEAASKKEIEDSSNKAEKEISVLEKEHEVSLANIDKNYSKNEKDLVSKCVDLILN